ncbi:hypothetical protein AOLI_G00202050 [Acnodon oligacanthus]
MKYSSYDDDFHTRIPSHKTKPKQAKSTHFVVCLKRAEGRLKGSALWGTLAPVCRKAEREETGPKSALRLGHVLLSNERLDYTCSVLGGSEWAQ